MITYGNMDFRNEVNNIDKLKEKLDDYLIAHNITVMKFALMAQTNPISLYAWFNTDGYSLDNLARAQIISYMNQNK